MSTANFPTYLFIEITPGKLTRSYLTRKKKEKNAEAKSETLVCKPCDNKLIDSTLIVSRRVGRASLVISEDD